MIVWDHEPIQHELILLPLWKIGTFCRNFDPLYNIDIVLEKIYVGSDIVFGCGESVIKSCHMQKKKNILRSN